VKILLLGANGQVGWELRRSLAPLGQITACDRTTANMENLAELQAVVNNNAPAVIVNAAAYTAVDRAESEPGKAHRVNAESVGLLAGEAQRLKAWLIHYSTDYVFDGTKAGSYTETDEPNPQSVYGQTKLAGEVSIRKSGCQHLVFRTSWVYSARGSNFIRTMLRLAKEQDEIKVVADQFGVPTSAELIADITALCIYRLFLKKATAKQLTGVYNLVPAGETSWYAFARYVLIEAKSRGITLRAGPENVYPISTSEYPLPAKRPANSRLDTHKLADTFGVCLPRWQDGVDRLLDEISD